MRPEEFAFSVNVFPFADRTLMPTVVICSLGKARAPPPCLNLLSLLSALLHSHCGQRGTTTKTGSTMSIVLGGLNIYEHFANVIFRLSMKGKADLMQSECFSALLMFVLFCQCIFPVETSTA